MVVFLALSSDCALRSISIPSDAGPILQREGHIASASLVSLTLERLVLDDQTPSSEECTEKCDNSKCHHDDECHKVPWCLAVVEEVWRDDIADVAAHVDLGDLCQRLVQESRQVRNIRSRRPRLFSLASCSWSKLPKCIPGDWQRRNRE